MVSQASWLLLLGLVSWTQTAEFSNQNHSTNHQELFVDQCTPVPTWSISGEKAVNLVGSNVSVIALLNSRRLSGLRQAGMLSLLRNRLYQAGFPAINFMVINSMLAIEKTELLRNEAPNITIYQEQPGQPVWDVLGAGNDHILVLDRCGRLAYQVITPFSKLTFPYVKAAILSTYEDNPCGFCYRTKKEKKTEDEGGNDSMSAYASDAPDPAHGKYQNESMEEYETNLMVPLPQKGDEKRYEITPQKSSTLRREANTKDEHNQTLIYRTNAAVAANSPNISTLLLVSSRQESYSDANTFGPKSEASMLQTMQEPHITVIRSQDELSRNWDWSQNRNLSDIKVEEAGRSDELSVEVVHRKRKKKKKKNAREQQYIKIIGTIETDSSENQGYAHQMSHNYTQEYQTNSLIRDYEDATQSRNLKEMSMTEMLNQKQKLYDWYQRQIENGLSSEEDYEQSDILKSKIIEHYSRLLPWLNYTLTPQNRA